MTKLKKVTIIKWGKEYNKVFESLDVEALFKGLPELRTYLAELDRLNVAARALSQYKGIEKIVLSLAQSTNVVYCWLEGIVYDRSESLVEFAARAMKLLEEIINDSLSKDLRKDLDMNIMENLRFNPGEEANDEDFAKHLAESADAYVNEAFAASHRKHASVVGIPKYLPHAAGIRFREEVDNLSKVLDNPKKPIVVVISGNKEDKLSYLESFNKFADKILIAGRLPEFLFDKDDMQVRMQNGKVIVAKLLPDKEDITVNSIERFEEEIKNAGTIVVSGPIGRFEDKGHIQGTERIFKAVANSKAFKIAGGGETQKAISLLGLNNKFDWISVGGGAMLEYLAHGTLPGIEALIN